ncbi:MAG: YbfB/YjiJ family MFS transporter [Moraxella sp.]|mgnify:FL=1|jgi:MFS family permease|nr:YbfB/YjiJ family MFS transporter [Moraxella osloensis]MBP6341466.1 YbfB/YjiJ family MFS transporter [Moraxella sp.]MBP6485606.1 YbfB/YjiJ family MFS transporter [Moraxella sp.]MBP7234806.1 YbfB/YjiJ family MFS transporter [Moraxella sp.]
MSQSDRQQIIFCFILASTALAVAMGIGRFAFTPILPLMIQEGTVHLAQTAWLSSSNYIGYLVGALSLLKSNRHPLFVVLGLTLVTLTTWLASLSSFGWLLVLRFLAGVASAWVLVSISAFAINWLKSRQVISSGLIYTGVGIGITLTGLICSYFIFQSATVNVAAQSSLSPLSSRLWQYLGVIALLATLLVTFLLAKINSKSPSTAAAKANPSKATHTNPTSSSIPPPAKLKLANVLTAYGLFGFGYILPATFLPQIAKQWLSGQSYLLIWPFFGLAAALSVVLSQGLQRRYNNVSLLGVWRVSQIIMAVGTLLPALWQSLAGLMLSALMVGGTFMVVTMAGLQVAASQVTHYPKYNLSALMTASFAFGQLIGPLTALIATGKNIWLALLPVSAIVLLIGVALLWRPYQHQQSSSHV